MMPGMGRVAGVTAGVVSIGLVWLAVAVADEPAAKPADKQTDTATAERIGLESAVTAKGAFEPVDYVVVEWRPRAWSQPLDLVRVVPHGTRVNAGDPIVEFDTEKLDRAIADLRVDLELGEKALEVARRELPAAEALHPLEMAEAEQAAKVAAEDLARFVAVEKAAAEEQTRFAVRSAEERLKYVREELRQLEKMYKDKDLTEETEEMILQRTRFDVVQAEQALKRIKENSDEALLLEIPRRELATRRAADKAAIGVEKARAALPLQLAQKRLAVAKQEHDRKESLRRLAELEADRAAAVVRAPRAGLVYHGRFRDGAWSTATVAAKAVVGQPVQPAELDFTVLDPDRLQFRAMLEEKDLHLLTPGLAGRVEPAGYPDTEVPVTLGPFVPVPRDGAFEAVFAVAVKQGGPTLLPGMTGTTRCVVAKRPDAITLPSGCVFRDDDGGRHVYLVPADGKPLKKAVKTGLVAGGRTEIVEGLAAGDRVRTMKP
jgi:HlyD family secretion protein